MTRITEGKVSLFIGGTVTLFILGFGLWRLGSEYSFQWASATTTATLTSEPVRFRKAGKHRGYKYRFDYQFTVAGQTYKGRASTRAYPSQAVTVYYERANPANNRARPPGIWFGWVLTIVGAAGFLRCVKPWRLFRRHEKLPNPAL